MNNRLHMWSDEQERAVVSAIIKSLGNGLFPCNDENIGGVRMNRKRVLISLCVLALSIISLWGCSKDRPDTMQKKFAESVVLVSEMTIPAHTIIGLGEATHGNKEFTELKQEVFSWVLENNGCKVFALEGDFGGCKKVNDYILDGEGSAGEAAGEIGFAIYNTQEMTDLIEWMYQYNQTVPEADRIHFYGYDMQRYDNNKEGLFAYLAAVDPAAAAEYEEKLADLNDETIFDQETAKISAGLEAAISLAEFMTANKDAYILAAAEREFDQALALCQSIIENATLRGTTVSYGNTRDQYMADKISWILEYERKYYGNDSIFIAGHNGHIEKTSKTMGITVNMGAHLAEKYGTEYYAIGTEFSESRFLAPDNATGERREFYLHNTGDTRMAVWFEALEQADGFLDFGSIEDNSLKEYLQEAQPISMVGEAFSDSFAERESAYTLNLVPAEAYDAIIFVKSATPSKMLQVE